LTASQQQQHCFSTHDTTLPQALRIHGRNQIPNPQPLDDFVEVLNRRAPVPFLVVVVLLLEELGLLGIIPPLPPRHDGRQRAVRRDRRELVGRRGQGARRGHLGVDVGDRFVVRLCCVGGRGVGVC
jgi:hypothetical protein